MSKFQPPADARLRLEFALLGALTLLLLAAPAARGEDWPSFRGDATLSGVSNETLPAKLQPVWTFEAEDAIESTAAIVDGIVYVGSLDGKLYALDLRTGKVRFRYTAGGEIKSSPSVHEGIVYFGDESGLFHAVDAKTGAVRWTFPTDGGVTSSANFAPEAKSGQSWVLFGSYDGFLYCLDAKTGRLIWKLETESYVHATPAVAGSRVYVAGCDGYFRTVRLSDGRELGKVSLDGYTAASPAVGAGKAYVGTFENEVLGLDLTVPGGAPRVAWRYQHPERTFPFYSSAAVTPRAVLLGGRDKLIHALDPATGKLLWTFATPARVDASPVVAGGEVLAASKSGTLYALDLATGKKLWEYETGAPLAASPAIADGHLVIGTLNGVVYAFAGK